MGALASRGTRAAAELQPGQSANWRQRAVWFLVLCAALGISRWVLAPRYLVTFDEINFALAVDHFDPRLTQPQPPGYPLFVGLLKAVALFVPKIETVFLIAGFLVSILSLVLVWCLAERLAGSRAGIIAALLLLFHPAFWLSALTNPVRLCFAAGSASVALCVWLALRGNSARWLPLAAAALGLSAGARPTLVLLLAPLLLWAAVRTRMGWKAALLASLFFVAAMCTWLPALVLSSGGAQEFVHMLEGYSDQQFGGTSLLFGAPLPAAANMAWEAVVWSCLGILSWIWTVPFVMRRQARIAFPEFAGRFLALWFFPGLLFFALIHVGDPDHTLAIIPATTVAGALAVAALAQQLSPSKRVAMVSICVLLNAFLFFKPISKTAKASTYPPYQWASGYIADVIDGVSRLPRPATAVFSEPNPAWRPLSYYDPSAHIVRLTRDQNAPLTTTHIVGTQSAKRISSGGTVALPGCGTLAWIDPGSPPVAADGTALSAIMHSRVFFTPAKAGEQFELHGIRFVSGSEPCGQTP
jgi:Dolichyl-phosphate-mannose-protein mannosyltransferase